MAEFLIPIEIAKLIYWGYWDTEKLDTYQTFNAVNVGTKRYHNCLAVVFPGTQNIRDTLRDLDFELVTVPEVKGQVARGFYTGLPDVMFGILFDKKIPIIVIGHSLGASRACIFGKMLENKGYTVIYRVAGMPFPGDEVFAKSFTGSDILSFKNNDDHITNLPPFPDRKQPVDFTLLTCQPMPNDLWLEFKDHHWQLYMAGIMLMYL